MRKMNCVYNVRFIEGKKEELYMDTLLELKKLFGVVSSGTNPVFVDGVLLYSYRSPNNIKDFVNQLNLQFLYQFYDKDYIPEISIVR